MFGGVTDAIANTTRLGDTWEFDQRSWRLAATTGPSVRRGHAMAYHAPTQRTILVGGGSTPASCNEETWAWNGSAWTLLSGGFAGVGRIQHAVASDADRGKLVLFGGQNGSGMLGDTWEFDGTTWTQVSTTGPAARSGHAMAYDSVRAVTVLTGGSTASGTCLSDTWEWNGAAWLQRTDLQGIGEREEHVMVYDELRGCVVVTGGLRSSGGAFNDFRHLVGNQWIDYSGQPIPRARMAGAYDAVYGSMLMFGGDYGCGSAPCPTRRTTNVRLQTGEYAPLYVPPPATTPMSVLDDGNGPRLYVGAPGGLSRWGAACSLPLVTDQPDGVTAVVFQQVVFSIAAQGTGPLAYQWLRDGTPVTNIVSRWGAGTPTLVMNAWSAADAGEYTCLVTGPLGTALSAPADLIVPYTAPGGAVSVEAIVSKGDPIPGVPGEVFFSVQIPALAADGSVAFYGQPGSGGPLVASWQPGSGIVLTRLSGDLLPALGPNVRRGDPDLRGSLSGNALAYKSTLTQASYPENQALWYGAPGSDTLIARGGQQAVGLATGRYYLSFWPRSNRFGEAAFYAAVHWPGMPGNTNSGVWAWDAAGGTRRVATVGDVSPLGAAFESMPNIGVQVSESGNPAFWAISASRTGFDANNSNDTGLWVDTPTGLVARVKCGDPAPGFAGCNFDGIGTTYAVSPTDGVLFTASVAGPQGAAGGGLFIADGEGSRLLAVPGQAVPDATDGATFHSFVPGVLLADGRAVFTAALTVACGSVCRNQGLYLADSEGLRELARIGDTPPAGTEPSMIFQGFTVPGLNAAGQVIFQAGLRRPGSSNSGVFGWTTDSGLFTIAAAGQQLEAPAGVVRTVSEAGLTSAAGGMTGGFADASTSSLLDEGVLVMQVSYTDGFRSIVRGDFGGFYGVYAECPAIGAGAEIVDAPPGGAVTLARSVLGRFPMTLRWSRNGVELSDGGAYSGAATAALRIDPVGPGVAGVYELVATNDCVSATSTPIVLGVGASCDPDFNCDGNADQDDVACIINVVAGNPGCECQDPDFNRDGNVDQDDVAALINVVAGGGCP